MILQNNLAEIIDSQAFFWKQKNIGIKRELKGSITSHRHFATIISGVRRCGKSTLMRQLAGAVSGNSLFLNFEDPRLVEFEHDDFRRLDAEIKKRKANTLFFDEIQMLKNWELYIRQKLDEGFKVYLTGSNATLLSRELGTKLTGRHLSIELFPFSYSEFLKLKKWKPSPKSVDTYLQQGGFPEYLTNKDPGILHQLLDDILLRDIAVRYGVRDEASLRKLAVYLLSNIGKPVSATNLARLFHIKAVSTLLAYFSHLQDSYIVEFVPAFSYSLKSQIRNPKKVYAIDLGMQFTNSTNFTLDFGRRMENAVFLHYRKRYKELFYFRQNQECDFVVFDRGKVKEIVQVCADVNSDNMKREIDGLIEALVFFDKKEGLIVTHNQKDDFIREGKKVRLVPINELLLD